MSTHSSIARARSDREIDDRIWAGAILEATGRWVLLPRGVGKYVPRIYVAAGHITMDKLCVIVGGKVVPVPRSISRRRVCWYASGARQCLRVFNEVGIYLLDTHSMAKAHAEFCDLMVSRRHSFDGRLLTVEEVKVRNESERAFHRAKYEFQSSHSLP